MNRPHVIKNEVDGVDSMLEIASTIDRQLGLKVKASSGLPDESRHAAEKAKSRLDDVRSALVDARKDLERIRVPKASKPVVDRQPARATVRR